jgi:hypothetical protein
MIWNSYFNVFAPGYFCPDQCAQMFRELLDGRVREPTLAAVRRDDRAAHIVVFRVEAADCASLETGS